MRVRVLIRVAHFSASRFPFRFHLNYYISEPHTISSRSRDIFFYIRTIFGKVFGKVELLSFLYIQIF